VCCASAGAERPECGLRAGPAVRAIPPLAAARVMLRGRGDVRGVGVVHRRPDGSGVGASRGAKPLAWGVLWPIPWPDATCLGCALAHSLAGSSGAGLSKAVGAGPANLCVIIPGVLRWTPGVPRWPPVVLRWPHGVLCFTEQP
jgi:hypothetical protein